MEHVIASNGIRNEAWVWATVNIMWVLIKMTNQQIYVPIFSLPFSHTETRRHTSSDRILNLFVQNRQTDTKIYNSYLSWVHAVGIRKMDENAGERALLNEKNAEGAFFGF